MRKLAVLLALALAVMACAEESSLQPLAGPTVEPFDGPGGLVSAEAIDAPDVDGRVWKVRYESESITGERIEVTGMVARPDADPPAGGFPILSWAHGTSGIADACAPSVQGTEWMALVQPYLDAGYVVAATDFEGLGTPGVHPYLVAESEGRSVLDAARAVRQVMPDVGTDLVLAGHSQGGHASLAASEIAADWSPDLDLVATVSSAPATDLRWFVPALFTVPVAQGFAVLIAAGWAGTYPDLDQAEVLGPDGLALARAANDEACVADVFAAAANSQTVVAGQPSDLPHWQEKVDENSIDPAAVDGPVLIVQGSEDALIRAELTDQFAEDLCAAGAQIDYRRYEGADHNSVVSESGRDILEWLEQRFAGVPVETTCE